MKISKKRFIVLMAGLIFTQIILAQSVKINYNIVDQRGGKKAKQPTWLYKSVSALEKDYPNKYAFIIKGKGADLDFVESWAKRVNAGGEVANYLSQSITDLTAASEYGNDANFQRSMETLTLNVSKAKIVGLRKEDDWWILKEYKSGDRKGQREYDYLVLYLIDKPIIDKLLQNEIQKALTGANSQTQERVKNAMDKLIIESGTEE